MEPGRDKTELSEMLFNLGSSDRLTLLSAISKKKLRLKDLSGVIDASAQECSRHLARLADSGFIKKNSDGLYETTSLGRAMLDLFPSIEFLLSHKGYFLAHDLGFLPAGFIGRIGELSESELVDSFAVVLELIKKVISTGREHVWLISDQPMVVGPTIGPSFFSREVPVRLIAEPSVDRKVVAQARSSLPKCEIATLPQVKIAMAINESLAGVCFSGGDGKIDFGGGFTGSSPQFRAWCSDLFEHYWARSKRLSPVWP